ncbi:MAG: hypothetical protein AB9882_02645 [Ignavibacteriaceae bacterium]
MGMLEHAITSLVFTNVKSALGDLTITLKIYCAEGMNPPPQPVEYPASMFSLSLIDLLEFEFFWDDREFWFGINTQTIRILDTYKELIEAIESPYFEKDKTFIQVEDNTGEIYKGFIETQVQFTETNRLIEMRFSPQTEKLAEVPTNINNVYEDPFDGKWNFDLNNNVLIVDFINEVLKLINPDIEVVYKCNLSFKTVTVPPNPFYEGEIDTLCIKYPYLFGYYSQSQFIFNTQTFKDVLKNVLRSLGLMAIFSSASKVTLINYNISNVLNTKSLLSTNIYSFIKKIDRNPIKYVELRDLSRNNYVVGDYGGKTGLTEDELSIPLIVHYEAWSLYVDSILDYVTVWRIKSQNAVNWNDWSVFFANYFGAYYTDPNNCKLAVIKHDGIDVDFSQLISSLSVIYFPKKINLNLVNGISTFELTPISEANYPTASEPANPETFPIAPTIVNGRVINEELITNGTMIIDTSYSFQTNTTELFRNGQKQTLGIDYVENGNSAIEFLISLPEAEEPLTIHYYLL